MPRDSAGIETRAYSVITVKAVDEEQRLITGIASTPSLDRGMDRMNPHGAKFSLPLPFLMQHQATPSGSVGHVISANVTDKGIDVVIKIEKDPALPYLDAAWAQIKKGLVRGLSIGFKPLAEKANKQGGYDIETWEWVELSGVVVPMNAEANIVSVKSIDRQQRGIAPAVRVVRLATAPDVSGTTTAATGSTPPTRSKGTAMATIQESIASYEAKRAANDARVNELVQKSIDEGRTFDDAEQDEHDRMKADVAAIDKHLVILRDRASSQPMTTVDKGAGTDPDAASRTRGGGVQTILSQDTLPKELLYIRHMKCELVSRLDGKGISPLDVAKNMYPDTVRLHNVFAMERKTGQSAQKLSLVQKANVTGLNTQDTAGGGPLAQFQLYEGDFVNWLRPQTIVGQFGQNGIPGLRNIPFMVSIAGATSGGNGYWVGQGKPKPLTSFGFQRVTLGMTKVANIAVVTEEQLRASTPAADATVRDALRDAIVERIDRDFIDPDAAGTANVQPASITYGATGTAATATTNAAVVTDLQTLMAPMLNSNLSVAGLVLIMSAKTALALSFAVDSLGRRVNPDMTMNGGRLNGIPVIVSQYADFGGGNSPATGGLIVAVNAPEIYLADDGAVQIAMSNQASLQMLDNPTNDVVTPTATSMVSMFQTDSVAIRAERFINWALRRPNAVTYLTTVAYNGLAS